MFAVGTGDGHVLIYDLKVCVQISLASYVSRPQMRSAWEMVGYVCIYMYTVQMCTLYLAFCHQKLVFGRGLGLGIRLVCMQNVVLDCYSA